MLCINIPIADNINNVKKHTAETESTLFPYVEPCI